MIKKILIINTGFINGYVQQKNFAIIVRFFNIISYTFRIIKEL